MYYMFHFFCDLFLNVFRFFFNVFFCFHFCAFPGPLQAAFKNTHFFAFSYENLDFKARFWVREERKKASKQARKKERKKARKKNVSPGTGTFPDLTDRAFWFSTGISRTRQVSDGSLYMALRIKTLLQNTSRTRQLKDGDRNMALKLGLCIKIPHGSKRERLVHLPHSTTRQVRWKTENIPSETRSIR